MSTQESTDWLLTLAESAGAVITGKPDGTEPITVSFTPAAWRGFQQVVGGAVNRIAEHALTTNPAADAVNMRNAADGLRGGLGVSYAPR